MARRWENCQKMPFEPGNALRDANDRIAETAEGLDAGEGLAFEFLCECSSEGCSETVMLTRTAYLELTQQGRVVLAHGHSA